MTPLGTRVLVQPSPHGEVKKGHLFIPEMAQSKPQEGLVVAVGSQVTTLHVGDRVLFGRYVASEVFWNGQRYLIMREPDVMALIEQDVSTVVDEEPPR